jgi:hypothetical protein
MPTASYRELAAFIGAPESAADALDGIAARGNRTAGEEGALKVFNDLPAAIERHRALGVPERITRDTFNDVAIALEYYAEANGGAFGIDTYGEWLHNHFEGRLYQVGRLQYIFRPYRGYARLYTDDTTGECAMIAEDGVTFRGDGLMPYEEGSPGRANMPPCESHWVSAFAEDERHVRANCLLVDGRAIQTPVALDKKTWRLALAKGMHSLNMHIPRGKSLTRADCINSLREAWRFHRALYPEQPFETFDCGSWMLETKMRDILPPSSGLAQFISLFRCYPLKGSSWSFLHRVFGVEPTSVDDLAAFARTADRSTSLRRGIADYWLAGGSLTSAGGIIHQYDLLRM